MEPGTFKCETYLCGTVDFFNLHVELLKCGTFMWNVVGEPGSPRQPYWQNPKFFKRLGIK